MTLGTLIAELTTELCHQVDETQPLDTSTRIKVRAYVVLAHAEFEHYVENLCLQRAAAIRDAADAGECHPALLCLALKYAEDLKGQRVPIWDLAKVAATCSGLYGKLVRANNGIKRDNLETLLAPLGISADGLSAAAEDFVLAAEGLASLRGPVAHVGDAGFTQDHYPSNAKFAVDAALQHIPLLESLSAL